MNIYQNIFLSPTKVLENEMPPLEAQHVVRLERPTPSDEIDHVFERVSRQGIPHQRHHALHATHHFGQIFGQLRTRFDLCRTCNGKLLYLLLRWLASSDSMLYIL